jgi:hypothetical protein
MYLCCLCLCICKVLKFFWKKKFRACKILIIPPKTNFIGHIGVTRWSVGRSVGPVVRCIFLVRSITWRLMVGNQYNFKQWSRTLRSKVQCTRTITSFWLTAQNYCPLLLFLVRDITWKLLVAIHNNFINWSSTITESAVHNNHDSI